MLHEAIERFCVLRAEQTIPRLGRTVDKCLSDYLERNPRALLKRVSYSEEFYVSTLVEVDGATRKIQRGYPRYTNEQEAIKRHWGWLGH